MNKKDITKLSESDLEIVIKDILEIDHYISMRGFALKDKLLLNIILKEQDKLPSGYERLLKNENSLDIKLTYDDIDSNDLNITEEQKHKYKTFIANSKQRNHSVFNNN